MCSEALTEAELCRSCTFSGAWEGTPAIAFSAPSKAHQDWCPQVPGWAYQDHMAVVFNAEKKQRALAVLYMDRKIT